MATHAVGSIEVGRDLSLIHTQHNQVMDLIDRLAGGEDNTPTKIITGDSGMRRLIRRAKRLASINIPVLIYGETGTGKELFAKLLHSQSSRAEKPFMGETRTPGRFVYMWKVLQQKSQQ